MNKSLLTKLTKALGQYMEENPIETREILEALAFIIWNVCEEPQGLERLQLLNELFTEIMEDEIHKIKVTS